MRTSAIQASVLPSVSTPDDYPVMQVLPVPMIDSQAGTKDWPHRKAELAQWRAKAQVSSAAGLESAEHSQAVRRPHHQPGADALHDASRPSLPRPSERVVHRRVSPKAARMAGV